MESTTPIPQNPQAQPIYQRAQKLETEGKTEEAQREYIRVLVLEPEFWPARFRLALLLQQSGQPSQAMSQFHQVLEQAPAESWERSRTFCMIGQLLLERGFSAEAQISLEQALRAPAPDDFAHFYLGEVFYSRGQWEQSRQHFEAFLSKYPADSYFIYRAQVLLKLLHMARLTGVDFEPDNWAHHLAHEPRMGALLGPVMTLPALFTSAQERQHWIQHWLSALAKLEAEPMPLRAPLWELPPPGFYHLALGPEDVRPWLERIQTLLHGSLPDTALQPIFPDNEFRTPRLGIWLNFQSGRYRSLLPLLVQLSHDYHTVLLGSGTVPATLQQQEALQIISLPRDLQLQHKEILALELDLLFYTELGPDDLNSVLLAHYRLAPVQAVMPGYPVSSGIATVDYYLSSELLEPQAAAEAYTEKLLCLQGLPWSLPVFSTPLLPRERFQWPETQTLYLCPVSAPRLHPDFDTMLAELCEQDPQALILVLSHGVPDLDQRLLERWSQKTRIDPQRLCILPPLQDLELMSLAQHADLILDPFYFGLGPQVLAYLALGTPVVSWPGAFQRSRLTQAAYRLLELESVCADSPASYLHRALEWGRNPAARQAFSAILLERSARLNSYPEYLRGLRSFIQDHIRRQF